MTVRERLRQGDFNTCIADHQPDGSVLVTLTKRGDDHVYKMLVRDLYLPTEVVVSEFIEELT